MEEALGVLLTQESSFGPTSMVFEPATARRVAQTLLRAADVAEGRSEEPERKLVVPKLAAVR